MPASRVVDRAGISCGEIPRFVPLPLPAILAVLCLPALLIGCSRRTLPGPDEAFVHETHGVPHEAGNRGAHWTLVGTTVVRLGGTNPQGIALLGDGGIVSTNATLSAGFVVDEAVATMQGTLLLDRRPGASLAVISGDAPRLAVHPLPPIGEGWKAITGTVTNGQTYVVAERETAETRPRLYARTSTDTSAPWRDLGEIGNGTLPPIAMTSQSNGERPHLFFFSRSDAGIATVTAFEPQRGVWRSDFANNVPLPGRFLVTPGGIAHVHLLARDEPRALKAFNTLTRMWTADFPMPWLGTPVASVVNGTRSTTLVQGGDGRISVVTSDYRVQARGLHPGDYAVIIGCAGLLVLIGVINSRRFRSADSYFRGGKKIPWFAAGLSVVATGQSATSFISLPARAFATNWQFGLVPLTNVFGALIMSRYFVRFFVRLNITSAYEYLEVRFSSMMRTLGSINYLAYELARISLLILVPAVAVSAVTRVDLSVAIVLMGTIATLYTTLGGLEGVVWADVVQITIKMAAIVLVVVFIFVRLDGSLPELAALAWREGKLKAIDWSFDLTRETFWALILFWLTDGLKSYVANQTIIQRFISTRNEKSAQSSIRASAVVGTLIFWTFLLAGTGLFLFYRQNPERFDLAMDKPDAVFPWFIVFELPPGVAGLLITALIAAALSSLYGALNSTSTVMVTDFYRRFSRNANDESALRLGRRLTLTVGVLATGLSVLLAGLASRSLVEQTLSVVGLFGGGLGGLFLSGMLTTRVSARSALVGFVVSACVQYYVSRHTPLHWLTYMFTGMGSCFVAAYLASFIWPETKRLDGLTVHTTAR